MAEALVALGLATNIVQFIDFASKVIATAYQTRSSKYNGLPGIDLIRNVNDDLRSTVHGLEKSLRKEQEREELSENQRELLLLAGQCKDIATELFAVLKPLKVHAKAKEAEINAEMKKKETWYRLKSETSFPVHWHGWQNFRIALRTLWKEDQIKTLEDKVNTFRQQLILRVLVSFRYVQQFGLGYRLLFLTFPQGGNEACTFDAIFDAATDRRLRRNFPRTHRGK